MNSKQLLMIAYYFPPLGGAGVQRSAKFAKYLAGMGWHIEVVSIDPPSYEPQDSSLLPEIQNENITVYRVKAAEPYRSFDRIPGGWRVRGFLQDSFLFPDRMAGWFRPAFEKADQICRDNPGINLFTTSAPYTAHIIGLRLKQKYSTAFWTADFRDEWTQNPYLKVPSWLIGKHRRFEHDVLQQANLVLSVTDQITQGLRGLAPDSKALFQTIPNGYDPDDFFNLNYERQPEFTVTHVGTLNQARAQLIKPLLDGIRQLVSSNTIPANRIRLNLVGPGQIQDAMFQEAEWLHIIDYLPHHEALVAMNNSNLLVLAESNPAAYTGKVFEYLGLHRPILGLVHPQSPAAKLIQQAKSGWIIGLNTEAGITDALLESYHAWQNQEEPIHPDEKVIAGFNRKLQATTLADLILKGQHGN